VRDKTFHQQCTDIPFFPSCHTGYIGARCEHADLLAVVAASQKKQAITALVVVSIVALAVLIITCVLIQ
jgi:transforming growth factor alpha